MLSRFAVRNDDTKQGLRPSIVNSL
jgi:hypothetical protein